MDRYPETAVTAQCEPSALGLGPDAGKEASFPPKTIFWTTQLQGASPIVGPGGKSSGHSEGAWAQPCHSEGPSPAGG